LSKNKKNPANKKALQIIDLQGSKFGGGEGTLIEPITEYLKFIKLIELV